MCDGHTLSKEDYFLLGILRGVRAIFNLRHLRTHAPHAHSAQVSAVNFTSTWRRLYRFWDCQHCSRQSLCNLCRLEGVLCCFVAAAFMQSFDIWFIKLLHYVIVGINQTKLRYCTVSHVVMCYEVICLVASVTCMIDSL